MKINKDVSMMMRAGHRIDKDLYRSQQFGAWYLIGAVVLSCLMLAWAVLK